MNKYILNGRNIKSLNTLYAEFARAVNAPNEYFGKCHQSFDDCLFGGFGLESPCQIIWQHHECSKHHLNSTALVHFCENLLATNSEITEEGKKWSEENINLAKFEKKTLFDEIVETINSVSSRASWKHEVKLILE